MELPDEIPDEISDENNVNNNRKRTRDGEGDQARCSKQGSKRKYVKTKRSFKGNRYTKNASKTPVSLKKIKTIKRRKTTANDGYRFMDLKILEDFISSLCCPCCFEKDLYLEEHYIKRKCLIFIDCVPLWVHQGRVHIKTC